MSTPVRNLVRQALSPKITRTTSPKFVNSPIFKIEPGNSSRSSNISKTLNFFNNNLKCETDVESSFFNHPEICFTNKVGIDIKINEVTDSYEDNLLKPPKTKLIPLINTPERKDILKNGLNYKFNWDILGKGSFGTVIQAIYKGEKVAMKLVKNEDSVVNREKNALNLKHKNIVPVLKVINDNLKSSYAIVFMPYFSSTDLQNLLDNNEIKISSDIYLLWALNQCEALIYCHRKNILHLDVKPKNILVHNNICLLCDFGNSLDVSSEEQKVKYIKEMNLKVSRVGTVAYAAPEIFFNVLPTYAVDVYALGITMWQMQSRQVPYLQINNVHSLIYSVVKKQMRPNLKRCDDNKSEKYQELFQKCWKAEPFLRPSLSKIKSCLINIISKDFV